MADQANCRGSPRWIRAVSHCWPPSSTQRTNQRIQYAGPGVQWDRRRHPPPRSAVGWTAIIAKAPRQCSPRLLGRDTCARILLTPPDAMDIPRDQASNGPSTQSAMGRGGGPPTHVIESRDAREAHDPGRTPTGKGRMAGQSTTSRHKATVPDGQPRCKRDPIPSGTY